MTCKELPPCPDIIKSDDFSIDLRSENNEFIPGVTCKELPPCPVSEYAIELIQDLTQEQILPGITCKELPVCPPYEMRDSDDISGVTCRPLPPCPILQGDSLKPVVL